MNDRTTEAPCTTGDPLISTAEVCKLLGVSRTTLLRYIERRRFPPPIVLGYEPGDDARTQGRAHRWPTSQVRAFIDACPRAEVPAS